MATDAHQIFECARSTKMRFNTYLAEEGKGWRHPFKLKFVMVGWEHTAEAMRDMTYSSL